MTVSHDLFYSLAPLTTAPMLCLALKNILEYMPQFLGLRFLITAVFISFFIYCNIFCGAHHKLLLLIYGIINDSNTSGHWIKPRFKPIRVNGLPKYPGLKTDVTSGPYQEDSIPPVSVGLPPVPPLLPDPLSSPATPRSATPSNKPSTRTPKPAAKVFPKGNTTPRRPAWR